MNNDGNCGGGRIAYGAVFNGPAKHIIAFDQPGDRGGGQDHRGERCGVRPRHLGPGADPCHRSVGGHRGHGAANGLTAPCIGRSRGIVEVHPQLRRAAAGSVGDRPFKNIQPGGGRPVGGHRIVHVGERSSRIRNRPYPRPGTGPVPRGRGVGGKRDRIRSGKLAEELLRTGDRRGRLSRYRNGHLVAARATGIGDRVLKNIGSGHQPRSGRFVGSRHSRGDDGNARPADIRPDSHTRGIPGQFNRRGIAKRLVRPRVGCGIHGKGHIVGAVRTIGPPGHSPSEGIGSGDQP